MGAAALPAIPLPAMAVAVSPKRKEPEELRAPGAPVKPRRAVQRAPGPATMRALAEDIIGQWAADHHWCFGPTAEGHAIDWDSWDEQYLALFPDGGYTLERAIAFFAVRAWRRVYGWYELCLLLDALSQLQPMEIVLKDPRSPRPGVEKKLSAAETIVRETVDPSGAADFLKSAMWRVVKGWTLQARPFVTIGRGGAPRFVEDDPLYIDAHLPLLRNPIE